MSDVIGEEAFSKKCPECDLPFNDERRYEYHVSTHKKANTSFTVSTAPPAEKKDPIVTPPSTSKPSASANKVTSIKKPSANDEAKEVRKIEWTNFIVKDANPFLFNMVQQYAGIPNEWCDGVVASFQDPASGKVINLWEPSLREQLMFSESDASKIAEAAARFSVSPMGQAIYFWLEANAGMIAIGTAAFVMAKYGWKVVQTKAQVTQFKEAMKMQEENLRTQEAMMHAASDVNPVAMDVNGAAA